MTATDVLLRARSVSDLPKSKFVDHLDELNSLNECWKDIYSALVENDDDYYVTEATLVINTAVAVAGSNNEYLIPLPADFMKIRYLDYRGYSDFMPVRKFNLSMKDNQPGEPWYRLKGSNLWIICSSVPTAGMTLRLGYYPAVATITAPQTSLSYGTSYAPNLFALVTAPGYAPYLQTMVYAYNGTQITSENVTNNTVAAPLAMFTEATAVTNIVYYKGVLYYIRGGLIWYKAIALTAVFVAPTQATSPTGVTSFFILNNVIYYTNATQIRSCDLTGGTDALISATVALSVAVISAAGVNTVFYTTAAGLLGAISPVTTLYATGISDVQSDGSSLYIRDTSNNLRKLVLAISTAITVTTDTIVGTDVLDIGQPQLDAGQNPPVYILPLIKKEAQTLLGYDTTVNYNFTYPNNLVPEIMAWQGAVDYRTKQDADFTKHLLKLGHRTNSAEGPATGLWALFEQMIKRDEYQPERTRNAYAGISRLP